MLVKILVVNLMLFAAYAAAISLNSAAADRGFSIAVGMGVCVVIHVVLNGIAALVLMIMGKRDFGIAFLISAIVLMPVGFVTWLILLSIFG